MAHTTMMTIPSTTPTREKATGRAKIPVPITAFITDAMLPMISATTSLETAIWWSGFGVFKIACVDLNKVFELRLPQWHVGSAHAELLYPMQRHFASGDTTSRNNIKR